jgi:hypothetical protein
MTYVDTACILTACMHTVYVHTQRTYIPHTGTYDTKMHDIHKYSNMHMANMSRVCIWRTCIQGTKGMCLKFKVNFYKIIGSPMSGGPVREGEVLLPILLQSRAPLLNHILWEIELYAVSNLAKLYTTYSI